MCFTSAGGQWRVPVGASPELCVRLHFVLNHTLLVLEYAVAVCFAARSCMMAIDRQQWEPTWDSLLQQQKYFRSIVSFLQKRIVPWKGIPSERHIVLADVWDEQNDLPALPKGFPRPVPKYCSFKNCLLALGLCCVYIKCVYCVVFHLSVTCGPIFFLLVWLSIWLLVCHKYFLETGHFICLSVLPNWLPCECERHLWAWLCIFQADKVLVFSTLLSFASKTHCKEACIELNWRWTCKSRCPSCVLTLVPENLWHCSSRVEGALPNTCSVSYRAGNAAKTSLAACICDQK